MRHFYGLVSWQRIGRVYRATLWITRQRVPIGLEILGRSAYFKG